jgi:tetratricopeptide (TPR) repeat protein
MLLRLGLIPLLLVCCSADVAASAVGARGANATSVPTQAPVEVAEAPAAPIELSDPDGQALTLEALSVRAAVNGPLALTELEIRFRNPQDRRIEGRFALTLPDGATISRFAKEVNGQLVEGEVVERQAAHRVYDTILHEMRDPALLEQDAGNRFTAKVFPIEPRAEVRLVLTYSQLLRRTDGARAYTLPLRGLPPIGEFSFSGRFAALPGESTTDLPAAERSADGVQRLDLRKQQWQPDMDVRVAWKADGNIPAVRTIQAGDYYITSFHPSVPVVRAPSGPWRFYVDTSASAADGIAHRIAAIEALLRSLPPTSQVEVRAFDQDVAPVAQGTAANVANVVGAKLAARGFAGGTDLSKVLADVARTARTNDRVVLATDGVATFGETNPVKLAAAAAALPGGVRLSALVLGSEQDGAALGALVAGRGRVVELPVTTSMAADASAAANRLAIPPGVVFDAADPNAAWIHAVGAGDVLSGDEVLVVGKVKPGSAPAPQLSRDGAVAYASGLALPARDAGPLVEREAVRAQLAALAMLEAAAPSAEAAAALAAEQVRLSIAHRVLCPKTTLLVLESEADYARFGLDRRALADILAVGRDGITTVSRAPIPAPKPEPKPEPVADIRSETKKKMASKPAKSAEAASAGMEVDRFAAPMDQGEADDAVAMRDEAPEAEEGGGDLAREQAPGAPPPPPPPAEAPSPVEERREMADASPRERPARSESRARRGDVPPPATEEVARPPAAPAWPDWINPVEVPYAEVRRLEDLLAANPRDRGVYNQLANALLATNAWSRLGEVARAWQPYDPENPHVYELMGEAALATGDKALAVRAFASLAEVAGGKPELLQRAGLLLWRAGDVTSAEVPLRKAVELRPDRVNAHRHLALLLRATGRYAEAADILEAALGRSFPDYYRGVHRVISEELGALFRDWMAADPAQAAAIRARAARLNVDLARVDDLRVTLAWETDGNDVDLHVVDPSGEECFYSHKQNASGLQLYEDLTQGLGPEVIRGKDLPKGKYILGVKYFSAGPMGVSRGLVVIEQPGKPIRVEPFRLVEGGKDLRLLGTVEI